MASTLKLKTEHQVFPMKAPLQISGLRMTETNVLYLTLEDAAGNVGRGEAYGVYYHGETMESMAAQLEDVRRSIERGIDPSSAQSLLPPGGARCALDLALWELEAKQTGTAIADIAKVSSTQPVLTSQTIFADTPVIMAAKATEECAGAPLLKLKLLGDGQDTDRVKEVRAARPDAKIMVDANQGFTPETFLAAYPAFLEASIATIEQPFDLHKNEWMDGLPRDIPFAADESFQSLADLERMAPRYDTVNIKLDKCGGLTEGLEIARQAKTYGLDVMVGCMTATSLSMAPLFYLAQRALYADVDGPLYLAKDRVPAVQYTNHRFTTSDKVWGRDHE